jgi:hypothetical protein
MVEDEKDLVIRQYLSGNLPEEIRLVNVPLITTFDGVRVLKPDYPEWASPLRGPLPPGIMDEHIKIFDYIIPGTQEVMYIGYGPETKTLVIGVEDGS